MVITEMIGDIGEAEVNIYIIKDRQECIWADEEVGLEI